MIEGFKSARAMLRNCKELSVWEKPEHKNSGIQEAKDSSD